MRERERSAREKGRPHSPVAETTVASLGELIDRITPEQPDSETGRWRDTGVYHGSPDAARRLLTSLDRLGGDDPAHTKSDLAAHILRNFARYSRPHFSTAPTNGDKSRSFDAFLDEYGLSRALTKFVIPAAHVARVRDQLDTVGMDERRLFPDVDGLAAELRRYYS